MTSRNLRLDIQGLRAIAVLLVVLYHANLPFLDGGFVGVDVFFVISGYLITSHISAGLRDGRFRFAEFYARRVRRILPASFAVLVVTLAVAWLVLPPLDLARVSRDAAWTALYVPNLLFAREGLDYLASPQPSLFQHYWSLGIEEQFYLLWPLLLWIVYRLSRKNLRAVFWIAAVVTAASFAASVIVTQVNQPWAFFLLPTRAWELAVGGLIAVAPGYTAASVRPGVRRALGGSALIVLFGSAVLLNGSLQYPSYWAAIPVVATATIIALGPYEGILAHVLQNRVFVWIGLISYSVYLVHWPLLTIPEAARSWTAPLELWQSLLLGLLSIPLGWASYRWIETPFRRQRPLGARGTWVPLTAALLCGVLVAGVAFVGMRSIATRELSTGVPAPAFAASTDPASAPFVGSNLSVPLQDHQTESAIPSGRGCNLTTVSQDPPPSCTYGSDPDAPSVALIGDSHAAQWAPAFEEIAESGTIHLTAHTRSGCPLYERERSNGAEESADCKLWKSRVLDLLAEDPPDIIVLGSSVSSVPMTVESYAGAMARLMSELPRESAVVLLRDTPRFPGDPMSCLSAHLDSPDACSVPRADGFAAGFAEADARLSERFGAKLLDATEYLCTDTCPLIQGDVLVFKDEHHLSKTFTRSLAPIVADILAEEISDAAQASAP